MHVLEDMGHVGISYWHVRIHGYMKRHIFQGLCDCLDGMHMLKDAKFLKSHWIKQKVLALQYLYSGLWTVFELLSVRGTNARSAGANSAPMACWLMWRRVF